MHKHDLIDHISTHANQVMIAVSNKITIAGASTAGASGVTAWVTQNQSLITLACGMAGVIIGLLGFIGSMYFQHLKHKRESYYAEQREAREAAIAEMTLNMTLREALVERDEQH